MHEKTLFETEVGSEEGLRRPSAESRTDGAGIQAQESSVNNVKLPMAIRILLVPIKLVLLPLTIIFVLMPSLCLGKPDQGVRVFEWVLQFGNYDGIMREM